jgi:hypothetical protein
MSRYGIYIDGLDSLKKNLLSGDLNKKTISALSQAIEEIHTKLELSVGETYATRKKLSSARVNKSTTSSLQKGINSLVFGLEYKGEAIPLQDFKLNLKQVAPNGGMVPVPNMSGGTSWYKRRKLLTQVEVQVRKDKSFSPTHRWFRGLVKNKNKLMIMRKANFKKGVKGTWIDPPTEDNPEGTRQPYFQLYGPSLPGMAEQRFEKDPKIQALMDDLPNKLIKALDFL